MNFLAEVLSSAEKVELQEVNQKVPELKLLVEDVKSQIVEFMENVYLNFSERPKLNKKILSEVKLLEEEINILTHNIEIIRNKQLAEATTNLENHVATLTTINYNLSIASKLCELNKQLSSFDNMLKNNEYFSCMKLICEIEQLPSQIPKEESLKFLQEIQMEIEIKKHTLLIKLTNVFSENIIVKCVNNSQISLKIRKDTIDLQKTLIASCFNCSIFSLLSEFARSLWRYFIIPAVDNTIKLVEKEDEFFYELEITIDLSKNRSLYPIVLSNLKVIFHFLNTHLNLELPDNMSVMKLIGDDISDNLVELIIKKCLEDTIPFTSDDLQNYKTVIQEIETFEKALQSYEIFTENSSPLMEYANNITIHFINKKCKEYSLECDIIMKKDLRDMKEVGVTYNPNNALDFPEYELLHCCVSESAIELTKHLEKIILQAEAASEVCAGRFLFTVKNILIKYGLFVPEYHSKLLQTIPQQVALFQNNCQYISSELNKWKRKFGAKFFLKLDTAFTEEAYQIQQIGSECFTNYVCKTRDSLIIVGIEGPRLEEVSPETEKSIRQCMRQQEFLKTVWHKVLSYPLYNRTIGSIFDYMCSNLISNVVKIEDISSKAAEQLVEVFKIVVNCGPKLFTDPKEVKLFAPSWYKFNELNFILAASLVDINERWADGKGPLALQFKASEMNSLVRALFQNTDRRVAVLAKIQD